MDVFVGAEYVIANALIELKKKGEEYISFDKLRNIGWEIQKLCNEEGINAIILTSWSRIKDAIYDFSDYFEYFEGPEPMIRVKSDRPITDLENRFVFCLPKDVATLITQNISKWVA